MTSGDHTVEIAKLGDIAAEAGLQRVSMLAWRDLDDPEAGGSELHASNIAALWAEAGIEVTMRTSYAAGHPQVSWRDGYRVIRKAGRYLVFPRAAFSEMMGWHGGRDGLVEIWNGMPFFSPLWSRTAHVTWLHHVHTEMWQMTLPPRLATFGNFVESKLAPPLYHRTPTVTLSESSKRELVHDLGFRADRVSVVPPGIDAHYTPGGEKSATPLVVAVGRLVPVKQFDVLVDALVALKPHHPDLEAVIVGEGYIREELEAQIHAARAETWITLPGRIQEDDKVDLYRRAWILASASAREGWGMTITEAAACCTPAVVSDVAGHADAVVDGSTGILAGDADALRDGIDRLLGDDSTRAAMSAAARTHAARFTWEATTRGTLEVLAQAADRATWGRGHTMKFTVIGHSCLRIETSGPTILVDPWLLGSCYWRSWWHYPTVAEPSPEVLAPDYVYLTHHHFDHFHFPSMRRIDRDAHVLVPKFGIRTLADEVRSLGFDEVMELPHGQAVQLAPGVRVASYQNGPDDSVFVVADGEHVLVDINDGKIRGRTLRKILEEFGRPTFVFKSYSFSQAYPVLYTADDPADLELVTRDTYLDDWVQVVEQLGPRYGVPFGSMVAFLHPDSCSANEQLVAPSEVVDTFGRQRPHSGTEAVQMDPGDSWSSDGGFELAGVDWYTDRAKHLDELAAQVAPKIAAQTAAEAGVTLDYAAFADYFDGFMHTFPPGVLGSFALRRPVVFEVPSSPLPFWVLDFKRRAVYRLSSPPPDTASIVTVNEAVLADAIAKRLVHVVHGSMRIRVHLRAGGAGDDLTFWGLVVPWELGYLPLQRSLRPRLAEVTWRRRAEWFEWGDAVRAGGGTLFERISGRLGSDAGNGTTVDAVG